jgi:hypothetical protein
VSASEAEPQDYQRAMDNAERLLGQPLSEGHVRQDPQQIGAGPQRANGFFNELAQTGHHLVPVAPSLAL